MVPTLFRGATAMGRFPLGGGLFFVIGVALIAVIVFLIIRNNKLKKSITAAQTTQIVQSAPETIVKERLAKGEINEEEYDKLLTKLKQ